MQHHCVISLAANCDHEQHLAEARRRLGQMLVSPRYTQELWTEPFGSVVSDRKYLNQLVFAQTVLDAEQLVSSLKAIEADMGRTAEDRRLGFVRIDLDLMLFDGERHHLRDWERPYIKALLSAADF